jgi:RNA polymerase sigma-B factor
MRQQQDSYLFPGAFAPILSLDQLCAEGLDEGNGSKPFDLVDPEPLPDAMLEREESHQAVRRYLGTLTPRDQALLRGVFWDDESQTEVAIKFGVSKKTISKAMNRILRQGRVALAEHEYLVQ